MDTPDSTTKTCSKCGREFPRTPDYFFKSKYKPDGLRNVCKLCQGHLITPPKQPDGFKLCRECGEVKPLVEFHRYNRSADGYRYICKACRSVDEGFNYHAPVPTGMKRCTSCKETFPANEEHFYRKDGARLHSDCKACYAKRQKVYRHKYPEKARASVLLRLARKHHNGGVHTADDVLLQYKTQRGLCWWCSKRVGDNYHVDHRVPLAKGGSNGPGNIVISCPKCNFSKNAKLPHEWNGRLL
jgi:5-methylcytosine-specific restriction endonuclease McrA